MHSALSRTALRKEQSDNSHQQNFLQLIIKSKCSDIGGLCQYKMLHSNTTKEESVPPAYTVVSDLDSVSCFSLPENSYKIPCLSNQRFEACMRL